MSHPTRVVVYIRNSSAPTLEGNRSIPDAQDLRPKSEPEKLDSWFKAGWRLHSVGHYVPAHTFPSGPVAHLDLTVMVLEHD
jgi:hypothetical protein